MKYVSIDIETTGVDRDLCQVLEIGAVVEDTNNLLPLEQLPTCRALIRHDGLYWEDVAKGMHERSGLLAELEDAVQYLTPKDEVAELFAEFLAVNGFPKDKEGRVEVVAAGKNFTSFDRVFLEKLPEWKTFINIFQRVLDPTLYFVDFANDMKPPSMRVCKERAGIVDPKVSHRAIDDALDVVKLLRKVYVPES